MCAETMPGAGGPVCIGVFDSGLGGFTVARSLMQAFPDSSFICLGDTARCPYGLRSPEEVRQFSYQIMHWLMSQGADLLVIACNTATACTLPGAASAFDVPILGVVGAGAAAGAQATRNGRVGVLATPLTIHEAVYTRALHALDPAIDVTGVAAPELVALVEKTLAGISPDSGFTDVDSIFEQQESEARDLVRAALAGFDGTGVDSLILGCTHFPVLQSLIARCAGSGVRVVSPSDTIAQQIQELQTRALPQLGPCARVQEPQAGQPGCSQPRGAQLPAAQPGGVQLRTGQQPEKQARIVFATTGNDTAGFARAASLICGKTPTTCIHVGVSELEELYTPANTGGKGDVRD